VAEELDGEHAREPESHVRVSGEVEVELHGIGEDAVPGSEGRDAVGAGVEGVGRGGIRSASMTFLNMPMANQVRPRVTSERLRRKCRPGPNCGMISLKHIYASTGELRAMLTKLVQGLDETSDVSPQRGRSPRSYERDPDTREQ